MASFLYIAREATSGRELRNSLDATSEQAVIAALPRQNLLVLSVPERASRKGATHGGKVSLQDLVIFTRQLATMIDAGLAVVQCLQALAEQTPNKIMRDVIRDVCQRVESGDSLSEAMARHQKTFSRLYIRMVAAGEQAGLLAEILARLATYLENMARLRRKVRSAMMYPSVIVIVAIAITIFLLTHVVPVFAECYKGLGAQLPGPTQTLIAASHFVRDWILGILLVLIVSIYGWFYYIKTPPGREFWDRLRIRLPIVGPIAHKICLARFARTLASLIRSGVPILEVLGIVGSTCGNVIMEKAVKITASDVERGDTLSGALGRHSIFPPIVVRMLSAGEQTGKMENMLEKVSDFLDEEIEATLSGLTSLIEPLLIVFLGVVVGGIAICMFLPIFKLPAIINK